MKTKKIRRKILCFFLTVAMLLATAPLSGIVAYASAEPVVYLTADPNNKDFVCGEANTQTYTVSIDNFIPDCDWGIQFFEDEACTKPIGGAVPEGLTYTMDSESPTWNPLILYISAQNSGSELKGGTYYVKGYFWDVYGTSKFYYSSNTIAMVIQKVDQDGPETADFTTQNETWDNFTSGNANGSISGLTTAMEVSSDGGTNWDKATGTTLSNLSAGTYKIRYATTDTKKASPSCEVEVKASYKVTNFSNTKGSVSAKNTYYEAGETVELTAAASAGYYFESVSYTDKNGSNELTPDKGKYSFTMPASAVTLSASLVTHIHDWTYEANGATLTATCKGVIGVCDSTDTTLTIQAPKLKTYGGEESEVATLSAASFAGKTVLPAIHYARKTAGGTYEELQAAPTDAGTYKAYITVNSAGDNVTAFVEYTIGKKQLSVIGTTVSGKTYDGTTVANATKGSVPGIVEGDDVVVEIDSATFTDKNAGNGKQVTITYKLTGTDSANYTKPEDEIKAADIYKKTVSVTADDKSSYTGSALVALTYTADKLLGTDKFTGALATNANNEVAGKYEITQGTLTAGNNYSIDFTKGTYEVTAAVKTGDANTLGMYILFAFVAIGAVIVAVVVYKKKRVR